jgi:hypothetical protein
MDYHEPYASRNGRVTRDEACTNIAPEYIRHRRQNSEFMRGWKYVIRVDWPGRSCIWRPEARS